MPESNGESYAMAWRKHRALMLGIAAALGSLAGLQYIQLP